MRNYKLWPLLLVLVLLISSSSSNQVSAATDDRYSPQPNHTAAEPLLGDQDPHRDLAPRGRVTDTQSAPPAPFSRTPTPNPGDCFGQGCFRPTFTPTPCGASAAWTPAAVVPHNIDRYAFAQNGNDFYIIGGYDGVDVVTTLYKYNVISNTWATLAPAPAGSLGEAPAGGYYNGKLYAVGGTGGTGVVQIYDIAANTWSAGATSPNRNPLGAAGGIYNGKLYTVGGGYISTGSPNTYIYDIAANTWSAGTDAPNSYWLGGYQTVGQYLYLTGSYGSAPLVNGTSATSVRNLHSRIAAPDANGTFTMRLDMSNGTWSTGPTWTMARTDFGLAYSNGKLYAMGGDSTGGGYFDGSTEVDQLDVSAWPAGTWVVSPPAFTPPAFQANQAGFSTGSTIWSIGGLVGPNYPHTILNQNLFRSNGGACSTPTPTVTPTPTATATNTPTSTPTPAPCLGPNAVQNPSFETGSFAPWVISDTNPTAVISITPAHPGSQSALLGTLSGAEPNGDGSIYQTVTVPTGNPQLSFWYWPFTTDTITFDWQDAYIENTSGTILATMMHIDDNTQTWTNKTFDMTPYAGQTVRIVFLVHQDGRGNDTAMYVDDVAIGLPTSCATTQVLQQTTVTAGNVGVAVASCPSGTHITGGGWESSDSFFDVYNSSMGGNGWQVNALNTSPSDQLLTSIATCMSGIGIGPAEEIKRIILSAGQRGGSTQACQASEHLMGGGFDKSMPPSVDLDNEMPDGNGWSAYAYNPTGFSRQVDIFALCYGGTMNYDTNFAQVSVPANSVGYAKVDCPVSSLATGGGFEGNDNLLIFISAPDSSSWAVYARNNSTSSQLLTGYVVCVH